MLYLYILFSLLLSVVFNLLSRSSLSKTNNVFAYTVLWGFAGGSVGLFFLPSEHFFFSFDPLSLAVFFVALGGFAIADVFLFSAFKYEEASVLASVLPFTNFVAVIISIAAFHYTLTSRTLIGFGFIILATLWMGLHEKRVRMSKGIFFALLTCLANGITIGLTADVVKNFSLSFYLAIGYFIPAVLNLFIFLRPSGAELKHELSHKWKIILVSAAINYLSFYFYFKAFHFGNIPQIIIIQSTVTILTAVAGIILLKEYKDRILKLSASFLATLGVILTKL